MRRFLQFAAVAALIVFTTMLQGKDPIPLAIWDFDGTIIAGDCSIGFTMDGKTVYRGIVAEWILSGSCAKYQGEKGVQLFLDARLAQIRSDHALDAYKNSSRVFAGADGKELTEFSRKQFTELKKYYFVDSIRILESLQKAGVEIHIISASADMIVRGAAESLGIPPENIHGVQLEIRNGTLTDKIIDPYPYGDGKVLVMRKIEKERNGKALYGFGNSYSSDGAFLLEIVKQGGKSMMINGGNAHPGMSEHFRCVNSTRMLGELPEMKQ